jgi:hypothetical protein
MGLNMQDIPKSLKKNMTEHIAAGPCDQMEGGEYSKSSTSDDSDIFPIIP